MPRRTFLIPAQRRSADPDALPADAPIPVTIATAHPVDRGGWSEVLDCSADGCDLSRQPLSLITAHDQSRLAVGVVENLRATGERVTGEVRFATSPEAQQIRADVLAGVHRYLSVGYTVDEGRETRAGVVYRWRPYEVSIVAVPADTRAGFFRSHQPGNIMDNEDILDTETQDEDTDTSPQSRSARRAAARGAAAEQQRVGVIRQLCTRHGEPGLIERGIAEGWDEQRVRTEILNARAERDEQAGGHRNVHMRRSGPSVPDLVRETLVHRLGGQALNGEVLRGATTVDLAARCLEAAGYRMGTGYTRHGVIDAALQMRSGPPAYHVTGDFPGLLGDAVGRVLMERWLEQPPPLHAVTRRVTIADFRQRQTIRVSHAPSLERVNEHGEFTYGAMGDAVNVYALVTFGRIVAISRQALVNDDLGGFADLISQFANASARRESEVLSGLLLSPNQVDGGAVFDAARNTEITSVLGITGLANAVAALRLQREQGELVIQEPAQLVVPAALEMRARQLVATYQANMPGSVQPWSLEVVVEPRLDASSVTAWYLVAGGQRAFERAYLEGEQGPQTSTREGFAVDGVEVKCRLDFGAGWVAPVGWVKSTGTVDPDAT